MSDSYPTIQESLSPMQREFLGCVEMHLDPPEGDDLNYEVEALYRYAEPNGPLPGNAIRFRLVVSEDDEEDLSRRSHLIEFLDDKEGAPIARISHSMKRIESWHGRYFWTESRFEVHAPDVPDEQASRNTVEHEVERYLERLKQADRSRNLRPVEDDAAR